MAAILDSLVGSCAKKMQEMITEEAVLILGVKGELKKLQRKMTHIQCFLNDAEERSTKESAVNNWLGDLRDAMYHADDIIDMARSEGEKLLAGRPSSSRESTKCGGILLCTCIPNVLKRHKIAVQIRDFNAELEKISKLGDLLKLQNLQPKAEVSAVKRTTSLVEPNLVGKETLHACKRLVELLLSYKERKDIEQQDLEMVGRLPALLELCLTLCGNREEPIIITGGRFQQIRSFRFSLQPNFEPIILPDGGYTHLRRVCPKVKGLLFEAGAMPKLKALSMCYPIKYSAGCFELGIEQLSSLASLRVRIDCSGVSDADVEAAVGDFETLADTHPNHPITLEIADTFQWDDDN